MEAVVGHIRQYFGAFEHVFHKLASPDIHADICVVTPSALCCRWPPAIARALLKNAPIVLLDEATASLDVENESAVQTALSRLLRGKTVLVIAHRMRTVAGADHIVVLENGRVAEQGTPAELMERGVLYRRMVELPLAAELLIPSAQVLFSVGRHPAWLLLPPSVCAHPSIAGAPEGGRYKYDFCPKIPFIFPSFLLFRPQVITLGLLACVHGCRPLRYIV